MVIYLVMLKFLFSCWKFPNFYPANLQYSIYKYVFTIRVEISVDPDQMDLDLQCFQNRINLGSAGHGLNFLNSWSEVSYELIQAFSLDYVPKN